MSSNIYSAPRNSIIPHRRTLPNFYSIDFHGEVIEVTVAKKAAHVRQWISHIRYVNRSYHHCKLLIGLDTEWRLSFARGEDHLVAVLQLCVGQHCLIFQLLHADYIPASLHAFLADPRHTFCGVGIQEDVRKLYDHHGLWVRNVTNLNELMARSGRGEDASENRRTGLKKMALAVLGKEMMKPKRVTLSKWGSFNLYFDQVEYAAIDAFVSCKIAATIERNHKL
ncbi:hypothetical protein Salat_1179000 [Sesamum alatum]|uniref:3'-5' exonuclease domain-containing protein n=1 Tax=Sesamum alatum TaxID=300844 RepID=A0AAE1YF95_9LAMI|nr:hypothetical protein Salat_1179000 [Sesamum alatum]